MKTKRQKTYPPKKRRRQWEKSETREKQKDGKHTENNEKGGKERRNFRRGTILFHKTFFTERWIQKRNVMWRYKKRDCSKHWKREKWRSKERTRFAKIRTKKSKTALKKKRRKKNQQKMVLTENNEKRRTMKRWRGKEEIFPKYFFKC